MRDDGDYEEEKDDNDDNSNNNNNNNLEVNFSGETNMFLNQYFIRIYFCLASKRARAYTHAHTHTHTHNTYTPLKVIDKNISVFPQ